MESNEIGVGDVGLSLLGICLGLEDGCEECPQIRANVPGTAVLMLAAAGAGTMGTSTSMRCVPASGSGGVFGLQ